MSKQRKRTNKNVLTFGSLFAGIGGFDLGFERAGMSCRWQVEIDDYANRVLEKHWPSVHRERDIRECGKHNLERVDVICGGFPCQDISYAGRGAGLDGERSGLFFEAIRLVRELQPRIIVLENVAALLSRGLDRVLGTLAEIGFDAEWHCIPAAAVGAPHIRDRLFVIGIRQGDSPHAECEQRNRRWKQFEKGSKEAGREIYHSDRRRYRTPEEQIQPRRPSIEPSTWWDTEPAVGRVANGIPNRVDRLRGLGNAVVPAVAEWIGKQIVERINDGEATEANQ